ncbi:MAG: triosephosphate isomerase [Parvicellaceae bacterium]|jgi:triosephosphate isomerase
MRLKIVAGNWKMNMSSKESNLFLSKIEESNWPAEVEGIIAPPSVYLKELRNNTKILRIAAQNCHSEDSGAYTGEISAKMINELDVQYCLVGHSERRSYFYETGPFLKAKIDALLREGIRPIYCCGEQKEERQDGQFFEVVKKQLEESIFHLSATDFSKLVIAYEPVWAIGTGLTASAVEAQEMHKYIRQAVSGKYGEEVANGISILYGGSCKPSNAQELFSCPDVDGGLIGGASLQADSFLQIAQSF